MHARYPLSLFLFVYFSRSRRRPLPAYQNLQRFLLMPVFLFFFLFMTPSLPPRLSRPSHLLFSLVSPSVNICVPILFLLPCTPGGGSAEDCGVPPPLLSLSLFHLFTSAATCRFVMFGGQSSFEVLQRLHEKGKASLSAYTEGGGCGERGGGSRAE